AIPILGVIVCLLGAVEATAHWWMHPAPAGINQPVLVYRPGGGEQLAVGGEQLAGGGERPTANGQPPTDSSSTSSSSPASSSEPSTINSQPSTSSLTPLPEVYKQAAPMLRCTTGQVFHAQLDDGVGLHLAFFEWNNTDTGSVLEAFRHMPEACMGSIGMKLVSREKSIRYPIGSETLVFDHTIFREPGKGGGVAAALGPQVHAFRAVWVADLSAADAREGIGGDEFDRLRTVRLKSALSRFSPSHARVIQGAVRGAANGEAAWQAFESAMLKDLKFQ
ncbi:MAG: hypothetical protein H7Y36_07780, partial [Armatimonadetes bacterium]|nr:hypothetical protein [Akkermansiaceae bacterium]